jgi:hypothetical protein
MPASLSLAPFLETSYKAKRQKGKKAKRQKGKKKFIEMAWQEI